MKLLSRLLLAVGLIFPAYLLAQDTVVFFDWSGKTGTQEHFITTNTVIDPSGNSFVAGATLNNSGDYDILVTMYDAHGDQQWTYQYNGAGNGNDAASDILVDGGGNVFVTGTVFTSSTDSNDAILIKLNSAGDQVWTSVWNNSSANSNDGSLALMQDGFGNIFTVGVTLTTSNLSDFLVLAYDGNGSLLWHNTWDNLNLHDAAHKIRMLPGSQLAVSGGTQTSANNVEYATVKFDVGNGGFIDATTSGGTASDIDIVSTLTTDANNDLYVTGGISNISTGMDMHTIKLDTSLAELWHADYNSGSTYRDVATDLKVGPNGRVYVCGYSETSANGTDIKVIRYAANGSQDWVVSLDGEAHGNDTAKAVLLDADFLYMTAVSYNGDNEDYFTVKLDTAGNILWKIPFNGVANGIDRPSHIAKSPDNSIYVAGQSQGFNGRLSHTIVRYVEEPTVTPTDSTASSGSLQFIANAGQLSTTSGQPTSDIKFYAYSPNHRSYFFDDTISLVKQKMDTVPFSNDSLHRVNVTFNNALPSSVRAYSKGNDYSNHYYSHIPEGRERVEHFDRVVNHEIWRGIDMEVTSDAGGLRYYFIVKPTGHPADISLHFNGQDSLTIEGNGNLLIHTSLGPIIWPVPEVWEDDGNNQGTLGWTPSYSISGSDIKLTYGTYSGSEPIVFSLGRGGGGGDEHGDLCWSTYFDGDTWDDGRGAEINSESKLVICGFTQSTAGTFPTTTGAFQTLLTARTAFLGQFKLNYERQWVTYFGDSYDMMGNDLAINTEDEVFLVGYTYGSGLPVENISGAYFDDTVNLGSLTEYDGFIAKFDTSGYRTWATYFGGEGDDYMVNCHVDHNDRLIVTGYGEEGNFPDTAAGSAYTQAYAGNSDAFIAQFTSSLALSWSTFYGGSGYEEGLTVKTDSFNNIYLAGYTESEDFPTKDIAGNDDHFDDTLGGMSDHFLVRFSPTGVRGWSSYIGGSGNEFLLSQTGKMVDISSNGNVYMAGSTFSNDFPLHYDSTAFNDTTYAGKDGYIMYFSGADMSLLWSSYISGDGGVQVQAIELDELGRIYLAGGTKDAGLPLQQVSGLYYQNSLVGPVNPATDAFLLAFNPIRQKEWLTYFGGDGPGGGFMQDLIYAISAKDDQLFATGITNSGWWNNPQYDEIPLYDPGNNAYFDSTLSDAVGGFITLFCTDNINSIVETNESPVRGLSLDLFPNPSSDEVFIRVNGQSDPGNLRVMSIDGKLLRATSQSVRGSVHMLDVSQYPSGVYIVSFISRSGETTSAKLVLK